MLLVPVAAPRVVEELPRDPGGEEAAIAALEQAVEDKYDRLRCWKVHDPAGVMPPSIHNVRADALHDQAQEELAGAQQEGGVLQSEGSGGDPIDDDSFQGGGGDEEEEQGMAHGEGQEEN